MRDLGIVDLVKVKNRQDEFILEAEVRLRQIGRRTEEAIGDRSTEELLNEAGGGRWANSPLGRAMRETEDAIVYVDAAILFRLRVMERFRAFIASRPDLLYPPDWNFWLASSPFPESWAYGTDASEETRVEPTDRNINEQRVLWCGRYMSQNGMPQSLRSLFDLLPKKYGGGGPATGDGFDIPISIDGFRTSIKKVALADGSNVYVSSPRPGSPNPECEKETMKRMKRFFLESTNE